MVVTVGRIAGYKDREREREREEKRDSVKVRWATEKDKIPRRYPR